MKGSMRGAAKWRVLVLALALAVVGAACGDDAGGDDETKVVGFISPGDTNDGGFYQSHLRSVEAFVQEAGWELIAVDRVAPADAVPEMNNLVAQGVDVVASAGGTEFVEAIREASEENPDVDWLLVGGSDAPTENYANATQNYAEIHYLAGVAAALWFERTGNDAVIGFVTGPEFDFTQLVPRALEAGLTTRIPDGEVLSTYTGDFNDAGLAVEATRGQLGAGATLMYPFLGGATGGVITEATEAGVALMIQPENSCDRGAAISVLFSQGTMLRSMLEEYAAGDLEEGQQRIFRVGQDPDVVGAIICDATAEEQEILDDLAASIADGDVIPEDLLEAGE